MRRREEIMVQLSEALVAAVKGTGRPDLSYEEGVAAALSWILGQTEATPISTPSFPDPRRSAGEWW